jgi:hypothetical protein
LLHNGAFLLVDAINPDGTIVPEVYHGIMKKVFDKTRQYEQYVNGNLYHNAAIWFATHAKYDPKEAECDVMDKIFWPGYYMGGPVAAASVLRENNVAFEVIGTKNMKNEKAPVMILSHVASITDEEMDEIEDYIKRGGSLYISGPIGNKRLEDMLGLRVLGMTEHTFTYMSPTDAGREIFEGFSELSPLTIPMPQVMVGITDQDDITVLATRTVPYTLTNTSDFAAIHSNPPGIYTDSPAAIIKDVGLGKVIWAAAPIEMSKPYLSRQVFLRMIQSLMGEPVVKSNAPKFVEVLFWEKDGKDYLAVVNEQEESPIAPMYDIYIDVKRTGKKAVLLPNGEELKTEMVDEETMRIYLPKLTVFHVIGLE